MPGGRTALEDCGVGGWRSMYRSLIAPPVHLAISLCRSTSVLEQVTDVLGKMFDRSNHETKAYHDLLVNGAIFGAAVFLIHRYGHKLAV